MDDRSGHSKYPAKARLHEGFAEGRDRGARRWISVERRIAPGKRPGHHAAERSDSVSRFVLRGRAVCREEVTENGTQEAQEAQEKPFAFLCLLCFLCSVFLVNSIGWAGASAFAHASLRVRPRRVHS